MATLDADRFTDAAAYLDGDLRRRMVEVTGEMLAARDAWVDAKIELARQRDDIMRDLWEESIAAQQRAADSVTRLQWNIVEQTERDFHNLRDELELLKVLVLR
jgi:hypothetical protein